MTYYIILRSSRRGNDNTNREPWGPARASQAAALEAILEELEYMFSMGDDPGRAGRTEPAVTEDPERSTHNRGALRLAPGTDAGTVMRMDVWDAASCPEGAEDIPELSDWWERFDIEPVEVDAPAGSPAGDDDVTVLSETREYITSDIRRLGRHMWDDATGAPKDDIVLDIPVLVRRISTFSGKDGDNAVATPMLVSAVAAGRDDIPMLRVLSGKSGPLETVTVTCRHSAAGSAYRHDVTWDIDNLLKTLNI